MTKRITKEEAKSILKDYENKMPLKQMVFKYKRSMGGLSRWLSDRGYSRQPRRTLNRSFNTYNGFLGFGV